MARLAGPVRTAALGAALALAACGGPSVWATNYVAYTPGVAHIAAADGPLPVRVAGGPADETTVVALLAARPNAFGLSFATDRAPGRNGYRLVFVFDALPDNPCAVAAGTPAGTPDPAALRVGAALCRGGVIVSSTRATLARPAGGGAAGLDRLVWAVFNELMPGLDPTMLDIMEFN